MMDKYHPGYFGKVGMRYYHKLKSRFHCPAVNVNYLWSLLPAGLEDLAQRKGKTDQVPVVDVTKSGYFKVLGNGELPKVPIVVKARYFSKEAERKIRAAGGVAQLTA